METRKPIDYRNKVIMAPMVRVGTLPMRLLALNYGADLVYTEELIDYKLLRTKRIVNPILQTVDFVDPSDGTIVFRTCAIERDKVVLQLGTADAERALEVAKMVENDVAAVDINMGCPKEFSIKGGMGAALLEKPEKAKNILRTLVNGVNIPITCKIRILPTLEETLKLVADLESTGISAIGIHGRRKEERPHHPVQCDVIKAATKHLKIPVIANGGSREIEKYSDIAKFIEQCGTSSVMIARAAQWNVSIFRRQGKLPIDDVITAYLKLSVDYDNPPSNTKYCVQNILRELQETPRGRKFLDSQTLEQICSLWDLATYCRKRQLEFQAKGMHGRRDLMPKTQRNGGSPVAKKLKSDENVAEHNVAFIRANYVKDTELPKTILHLFASKSNKDLPTYVVRQVDKLFKAVLSYEDKQYSSTYWEKNKKYAEQGAALVCLLELGLMEEQTLIDNGTILG